MYIQTLDSWLEESAHRDDDAMILAKYSRIDEDQIKSLNLRLEQLQEMATRKKRLLDTESTETMAAQVRERDNQAKIIIIGLHYISLEKFYIEYTCFLHV